LLGVAAIVIDAGASEVAAAAALLHDSVEDHPELMSYDRLIEEFSPAIEQIVRECSDGEPEMPRTAETWLPRKEAYINKLGRHSSEGRLVSLADKLYNARASVLDLRAGHNPWAGPNAHAGAKEQLWYYDKLVQVFIEHPPDGAHNVVAEFAEAVAIMKGLMANLETRPGPLDDFA
jgi:hypothetical protein